MKLTIDEVLSRPEFVQKEDVLTRFLKWLFESLGIDGGTAADLSQIVLVVLIATAVCALVYFLVQLARLAMDRPQGRDARRVAGAREVADRVEGLWRDAEAARARGDRVLALRLYFFALVVGLGERGDLEYRDAWTPRELLARGEPEREVERLLRPWLARLNAVSFGGVEAREADVEEMVGISKKLLGEVVA